MKSMQWLRSAVLVVALPACASQQPVQRAGAAPQPALTTPDAAPATIDGAGLKVFRDRAGYSANTQISLLDVLRSTGKKVGIIQFAGVECAECIDTSKHLEALLKTSPKGKDIAHIVVVTDFFSDYSDLEFRTLLASMAPDGVPVFDEAKLWKRYIFNKQTPRATIIAMNLNQQSVMSTQGGAELSIIPAAEALVK